MFLAGQFLYCVAGACFVETTFFVPRIVLQFIGFNRGVADFFAGYPFSYRYFAGDCFFVLGGTFYYCYPAYDPLLSAKNNFVV